MSYAKKREKTRGMTGAGPVRALFVVLGAVALGSCKDNGVVDPDYQGTELAEIRGQVSAITPPAADSVSLGIVWVSVKELYDNAGPGGYGGGGFPGNAGGAGGLGGAGGFGGEGGHAGAGGFGGEGGFGGVGGFGGAGDFGGEGGFGGAGGLGGGAGGLGGGAAGSDQPGLGGAPVGSGTGGISVPRTATTILPRESPGPNGSVLAPPLLGCDGTPAAVRVDDGFAPGATPIARVVSYKSTFPVSFTIPITTLPPPEALVPLDIAARGSGTFASARIVAFIDENHNGKLDLPSVEGGVPDTILAVSTQQIAYLNGVFPRPEIAITGYIPPSGTTVPLQVGYKLPQGFSILDISQNVLPASTPIDLPLAETKAERDNAVLQVCATFQERIEHFEPTQTAPADAFIIAPGADDSRFRGVGWHYYPDSGNPCYQLAFLGHICQ